MHLKLENKVFIISGASRGIGYGIAKVLLEEGSKVVLTGRNTNELSAASKNLQNKYPGKILCQCGDISREDTLACLEEKVISEWGGIDGVVANAGAVRNVPEILINESDWAWYHNANFTVAVKFIQKFVDHLIASKGSIVFVTSIAGSEDVGAPLPYAASKSALSTYSKSLSKKLGSFGVRVNAVSPGNILFKGGNWDMKCNANPQEITKMLADKVPLGTFGDPSDIGNMVAFLLSEKAKFITGSSIVVDGGQTITF